MLIKEQKQAIDKIELTKENKELCNVLLENKGSVTISVYDLTVRKLIACSEDELKYYLSRFEKEYIK